MNVINADAAIRWPDVFHNPDLVKSSSHKELLAAGLCAWANVEMGHKPPESFGEVLVSIAKEIGMIDAPSGDGLMRFAKHKYRI